ncbi:MAG: hypothetical protein IQL11_12340, partial [Bacteroidales bacterium]|nr:hypothetical protein [Bacteroidales bacterium]
MKKFCFKAIIVLFIMLWFHNLEAQNIWTLAEQLMNAMKTSDISNIKVKSRRVDNVNYTHEL